VLLQLSGSHSSYAGYSSLQQLSSGEVLCLWEGACTTASFLQANVMCLASVDVGVNEEMAAVGRAPEAVSLLFPSGFKMDDTVYGGDGSPSAKYTAGPVLQQLPPVWSGPDVKIADVNGSAVWTFDGKIETPQYFKITLTQVRNMPSWSRSWANFSLS
jgi:hypothetical protein